MPGFGQVASSVKATAWPPSPLLSTTSPRPCHTSRDDDGTGATYVAVDLIGAGDGEIVLVTRAARPGSPPAPPRTDRCRVVGIVDSVIRTAATFVKR